MRTHSKSERPLTPRLTKVTLLFVILLSLSAPALADQLRLADGTLMEVDEAWEDSQGVWYRRGGVTHWVERSRVKEVVKGESRKPEGGAGAGAKEMKATKAAGEASAVNVAGAD